jgi:four helix bundle protein
MQDFHALEVWQVGHQIVLDIYKVTQGFPKAELFGLTSQIRRAAASVPTNIAEGVGRRSDGSTRAFLEIALGSANEVLYLLELTSDLGYLRHETRTTLEGRVNSVRRMLNSFISRLLKNSRSTPNGQRPKANGPIRPANRPSPE